MEYPHNHPVCKEIQNHYKTGVGHFNAALHYVLDDTDGMNPVECATKLRNEMQSLLSSYEASWNLWESEKKRHENRRDELTELISKADDKAKESRKILEEKEAAYKQKKEEKAEAKRNMAVNMLNDTVQSEHDIKSEKLKAETMMSGLKANVKKAQEELASAKRNVDLGSDAFCSEAYINARELEDLEFALRIFSIYHDKHTKMYIEKMNQITDSRKTLKKFVEDVRSIDWSLMPVEIHQCCYHEVKKLPKALDVQPKEVTEEQLEIIKENLSKLANSVLQ